MAGGLPIISQGPPPSSPCQPGPGSIPCTSLASLISTCGTCGGVGGPCSCGGTVQPCGPGTVVNQCGCCVPATTSMCPAPDIPNSPQGCSPGYTPDPARPGCCLPAQLTMCPGGELTAGPQGCPTGYVPDPAHPGCCVLSNQIVNQGGCPTGDVQILAGAACPQGMILDPNASPPAGFQCCKPQQIMQACPTGMTPPCGTGFVVNPQTGCCVAEPVEACFVCPGGLPDLAAALQGLPNGCFLASQMFYPPGAAIPTPLPA